MNTIKMILRSISSQVTEGSKAEDLTHVLQFSQEPGEGVPVFAMVPQVASMTIPATQAQAGQFVIGDEYDVTIG